MPETRFIDTNILLRHLVPEDPRASGACRALLARAEQGLEFLETSDIVVFEAVYVLESKRHYGLSRDQIRDTLGRLISMAGLSVPSKDLYPAVFDLYCTYPIDFADAFHAVYARSRAIAELYSYDRDLDRIPGITRLEPKEI